MNVRYFFNTLTPIVGEAIDDEAIDDTIFRQIKYVQAKIINYNYEFLIPGISPEIQIPAFTTIIPSESLGIIPYDENPPTC